VLRDETEVQEVRRKDAGECDKFTQPFSPICPYQKTFHPFLTLINVDFKFLRIASYRQSIA
jgi:hypothetical protein